MTEALELIYGIVVIFSGFLIYLPIHFKKNIKDRHCLILENRELLNETRQIIRDQHLIPILRNLCINTRKMAQKERERIDIFLENERIELFKTINQTGNEGIMFEYIGKMVIRIVDSIFDNPIDTYFDKDSMENINPLLIDLNTYIKLDDELLKNFTLFSTFSQRKIYILNSMVYLNLIGAITLISVLTLYDKITYLVIAIWVIILLILFLGVLFCDRKYNKYYSGYEKIISEKQQKEKGLWVK